VISTSLLIFLPDWLKFLRGTPADEEWLKKCAVEHCPALPPDMWTYKPDPHEFLHFTVAMCISAAIFTLVVYLQHAVRREFSSAYTEDDASQASDRIGEAIPLLLSLQGGALRQQCALVVKDLLIIVHFVLYNLRLCYFAVAPEDENIVECVAKSLRAGRLLLSSLNRTRLMLLFAPLLSLSHKRTMEAAQQYAELMDLLQSCCSKLADAYKRRLPA
jgi:hypothetical protein